MSRIVVFFSVFACLTSFQACSSSSSQLSLQQVAAYSVATGFLTLCDDGNYKNALYFYTQPIKSYPEGATWITQMRGKRAPFGIPIWRDWVNRKQINESPKMAFQFRTSFSNEPLVDELVSVTRISGRWRVDDYKFHALGKHPSAKHPPPVPTPSLPPGGSRSSSPRRHP
jgi:hypothetical protein